MTAITGRPAYRQVADDLREKITQGAYTVGTALPSTKQLMESYRASITVVRAAIKELQIDGVVIGQPGKGVYVQRLPEPNPETDPTVLERLDKLAATVDALAERLTVLEQERRPHGR